MLRLTQQLEASAALLDAKAVAGCLWSLAKLSRPPLSLQLPPGLAPALAARLRALLHGAGPWHTAVALWGLARLRAAPDERFWHELWRRSAAQLGAASPQDLANLGWATAELKALPPDPWAAAFCDACCARFAAASAARGFEARGVVQVAYALARWGAMRKRQGKQQQLSQPAGPPQQQQEGSRAAGAPAEVAGTAEAAAARRESQGRLVQQLLAWTQPRLGSLPLHELADLLIAVAGMASAGEAGGQLPAGWGAAAAAAAAAGPGGPGAAGLSGHKAARLATALTVLQAV
jgi:hypothetical protein